MSRLEFIEEFSENNFALPDAKDNTSGPLNRGGIADLPLLRTLSAFHQKSQRPSFCELMESQDLFFWYKWKKRFLWIMAAAKAAENHGDESGLT